MLQQQKNRIPLAAGAGLFILLIGFPLLASKPGNWLLGLNSDQSEKKISLKTPKSDVFSLVSLSPEQRQEQLQRIVNSPLSPERDRARYLLASDLIQQQQGGIAIKTLDGLEQDYPVLAAYIVFKRAQAYEQTGNNKAATTAWQDLLEKYPDNPVSVEALYALGRIEPKYWQQAIVKFPAYPRTLEIARLSLQQNPNQPQLLLLLAKYAYTQPGIIPVLDQLVKKYAADLQPQNWEVMANSYWANQIYDKAAAAYAKAPSTPRNLYRLGRSLQLNQKQPGAIATYQQLVRNFPNAEETGTALMRLAKIAKPEHTIIYLDEIVKRFPKQAGEALAAKAAILDSRNSKKSAAQARQLLLTNYSNSEAAAEYRWQVAQKKAATGDYRGAWQWAQTIPSHNPKSILAPRAAFWIGKWAQQMGKKSDAQTAFRYVLSQFPQSYYAWRSAVALGLDVGDFNHLRQINPQVVQPMRSQLLAGSDTLEELYQLGQDRDAWARWQVEFQNQEKPTVAEQYTDGLMHLAKGENIVGINEISTLEDREEPQQAEYQALSQQLAYWQARYPFPFQTEIENWSQQRQINPLLVTALIRQESRFEPEIRSAVGAIGLMQVMPGTGKWIAEKINEKQYNLVIPADNIRFGTWFLDYTHQQYDNNSLLAVASYNAGPGNVSKWRSTLGKKDEDEFVEAIPFDETRNYVRQVFGNYWNYLRLYNPQVSLLVGKYSARSPKLNIN